MNKYKYFINYLIIINCYLFTACTPIEGTIDEVLEMAGGGQGPSYTVTFNSNGGSPVEQQKISSGKQAIKPDDPIRDDMAFTGWYTSPDFNLLFDFSNPITVNIILFADWKPAYYVQYNANWPAELYRSGTMDNSVHALNTPKALTANAFACRGWELTGWAEAEAGDKKYNDGQVISNLSSLPGDIVVLYAKWNYAVVPSGGSLAQKLDWIENNAITGREYTVTVNANETAGPVSFITGEGYISYTIYLSSTVAGITITLSENGSLFTVDNGITLVLENITLQGKTANNAALIRVNLGGTLILNNGAKITGNRNNVSYEGGGVYVNGGTVTMNGGEISGNYSNSSDNTTFGGGVYLVAAGKFTMNNGKISNNTSVSSGNSSGFGGGVYMSGTGTEFSMKGGEISGNTANTWGGGLHISYYSTFTMEGNAKISGNITNRSFSGGTQENCGGGGLFLSQATLTMKGGEISGNTTAGVGGGVNVCQDSTFNMEGGTISGNTVIGNTSSNLNLYGGGVYIHTLAYEGTITTGTFIKTGGTINGYTAGDNSSNTVKNSSDTALINRGHAVFVSYYTSVSSTISTLRRRESTAGLLVDLNSGTTANWE